MKMSCLVSALTVMLWCCVLVQSDRETDDMIYNEYSELYTQMFNAANVSMDTPPGDLTKTLGADYPCNLNTNPPNSVHELSPEYVDVVAAMGDSVTAGFGARATLFTPINVFREFRGVSWSIGGDETVNSVTTLPNAIRKFNPGLRGFSTGIGTHTSSSSVLNVAVSGSRTRDMLGQAVTLVERMREMGVTDNDWKVITLWIGGNDLCDVRINLFSRTPTAEELAAQYTENVRMALDYLKNNVKRAFVNMVQMIDIADLSDFQGPICGTVHKFVCNGIFWSNSRARVSETVPLYNRNLMRLIDNGRTYDSDDFAVVLQPFFIQTDIPRTSNGSPDHDYFAPDCFHFSQLGHSVVATYLWNNMFEPVGSKTTRIDWDNLQPLKCPAEWPYFSTYGNTEVRKNALISADTANVDASSSLPSSTVSSLIIQIMAVLTGTVVYLLS